MRSYKSVSGLLFAAVVLGGFGCEPEPCTTTRDVSLWQVVESPSEAVLTPITSCGVITGYRFDITALPSGNVFWKMAQTDKAVKGGTSTRMAVDVTDIFGVSTSQRIQLVTSSDTEFAYAVPVLGRAVIAPTTVPVGSDGITRSFTVMLPSSGRFAASVSNFVY